VVPHNKKQSEFVFLFSDKVLDTNFNPFDLFGIFVSCQVMKQDNKIDEIRKAAINWISN
jgi:hypothetical protein